MNDYDDLSYNEANPNCITNFQTKMDDYAG